MDREEPFARTLSSIHVLDRGVGIVVVGAGAVIEDGDATRTRGRSRIIWVVVEEGTGVTNSNINATFWRLVEGGG